MLGFPYAVMRKYFDDGGGREAALITYYGFLSIFPVLLLGVTIVSRVLAERPDLRQRLVVAIVPPALQETVGDAAAAMPTSPVALAVGLIGLLLSGTGVVFSAGWTLNHVAAIPYRERAGIVSRYLRVLLVLMILLTGTVAVGGLTVVVAALPRLSQVLKGGAILFSCLIVFVVLTLAARLLLARPVSMRALWPAAVPGSALVTLELNLGAAVLPGMIRRAGAVYGSFATVAGMLALLYLLSTALVFCAEIAVVRHARLWPRAIDENRPTEADRAALGLLAREQERTPAHRIRSCLTPPD